MGKTEFALARSEAELRLARERAVAVPEPRRVPLDCGDLAAPPQAFACGEPRSSPRFDQSCAVAAFASTSSALRESLIRPFSSTLITFTLMVSPTLT